jgi:hypothetical protein
VVPRHLARFLLGAGYYRSIEEALKLVDVESLVELIELGAET